MRPCEAKGAVYPPFLQPGEEVRCVEDMTNKKRQIECSNECAHAGMFPWPPQTVDLLEIYI